MDLKLPKKGLITAVNLGDAEIEIDPPMEIQEGDGIYPRFRLFTETNRCTYISPPA